MTGRVRMRVGEVARAAGVSAQHVRDLERLGVVPAPGRAANGYRVYTRAHRSAVVAYRALVVGHGIRTAQEVMRAVTAGDVDGALEVVDVSHAAHQAERQAVRLATRALDAIAAEPVRDARAADDMTIGELAGALGVRTSALRSWESYGLLAPDRDERLG